MSTDKRDHPDSIRLPVKLDQPTSIRLHDGEEHLIEHISYHLSDRELDLMARAYRLGQPGYENRRNRKGPSKRTIIITHILSAGLTKLSHNFNPKDPYHLELSGYLTSLVNTGILTRWSDLSIDQVEHMIIDEETRRELCAKDLKHRTSKGTNEPEPPKKDS